MVDNTGAMTMASILKGIPTTASDWQLFTSMEGAEEAAGKIAQAFSDALRTYYTPDIALDEDARTLARSQVRKATQVVMKTWSDFGATDSEPLYVLYGLLDKAFPMKSDW
jgi:hypothetical protein